MEGKILFEYLQKAGYIKRGKVVKSAIQKSTLVELLDFVHQFCELTSAKDISRDNSIFSQSASLSLGCSRWPCHSFVCRLKRAEELAHYAALYGDRIYVRNFLADHIDHFNLDRQPNEEETRIKIAEDLGILLYLKPIIEAGKIVPINPPNICLDCLSKHSLGLNDDKPLQKAMKSFTTEIKDNILVDVSRIGNSAYFIEAKGPINLLHDGFAAHFVEELPLCFKDMPRIFKRVQEGKKVVLSRWALNRIGYAEHIANYHYRSIFFELTLAQCLGTGFLTDMPAHIKFLKSLSLSTSHTERDLDIERHLTSLVPFAKELKPSEILKLRKGEEEAFILYKSALASAVSEYKKNYGTFTEKDAKMLYHDIIKPELCKLEAKIKKSRRTIIKGTTRKILAWTAAISFGTYFGLLPEGLSTAAAALGLTNILADFTENLMHKSDPQESIREQDMYFLWKLNKGR